MPDIREPSRAQRGSGAPQPPPSPGRAAAPATGEIPDGLVRRMRPASPARDDTPSPAVPATTVLRGRGRRAHSHLDRVSQARGQLAAVKAEFGALTSVLHQLLNQDPDAGAAWAWTVIHLLDALTVHMEGGVQPHPAFRRPAAQRLDPAGWAPPAALTEVAVRLAGGGSPNGGQQ